MKSINEIVEKGSSIGRLEYFLYGVILPIIIILVVIPISELALAIGGIAAACIYLYFSIKRARDTKYRTGVLIFWLFIPYIFVIPTLILLFAPHGDKDPSKSSKVFIIAAGVLILIILGILAAVTIPKLNQTHANHETVSKHIHEMQQLQENSLDTDKKVQNHE